VTKFAICDFGFAIGDSNNGKKGCDVAQNQTGWKERFAQAYEQLRARGFDGAIAVYLIICALMIPVGAWFTLDGRKLSVVYVVMIWAAAVVVSAFLLVLAWGRLIAFGKWADEAKKKWQETQEMKK